MALCKRRGREALPLGAAPGWQGSRPQTAGTAHHGHRVHLLVVTCQRGRAPHTRARADARRRPAYPQTADDGAAPGWQDAYP